MDIQEVARRARVSTATVSRVLNRSAKVRPVTAERVQRVIDELHYIPNTSARHLRSGHTRLFGLIVSDIKNPFFPELIARFEALSAEHGIDMVFTHTNYDPKRLEHCLRRLVERNVDGIAVMTSEVDVAALEQVKRRKTPLVLLNQVDLARTFSNVHVDYTPGFEEAILHLKSLGHIRIGFLAGPSYLSSAQRRHQAFIRTMTRCNLRITNKRIAFGTMDLDGGQAAMRELLKAEHPPSAVLATNDLMAIGALQVMREQGIHVPSQISVIGFDDLPIAGMLSPALTTIALPRQQIAEYAFAALRKMVANGNDVKVQHPPIQTALILRASTGPAQREVRTKPQK
jgi:DNA-binding LacI/PurR family transcriptional regulator